MKKRYKILIIKYFNYFKKGIFFVYFVLPHILLKHISCKIFYINSLKIKL